MPVRAATSRPARRYLAVLLTLTGVCVAPAGVAAASPGAARSQGGHGHPDPGGPAYALPLGDAGLTEERSTVLLAAGATLTTIVRGRPSPAEFWTVTVGFTAARAEADALAGRLLAAGFEPRVERVTGRSADDPATGAVGFVVRTGRAGGEAALAGLKARLTLAGFAGSSVTSTALDGRPTSGPWVVHVIDVDPRRFRGTVQARLATDIVPGRETTSGIAARTSALAGVNGGYFVIPPSDGTPGDLAGISVVDGRLVSEAVNGRAALVLRRRDGDADIARLSTALSVTVADGATRALNGLNRVPGLIRSCGERGARPTDLPRHDVTCTNPDDLVELDSDFGTTAAAGPGEQVVLDRHGRVAAVATRRGGAIPSGGAVLEGIGEGAVWLARHAGVGSILRVRTHVVSDDGRKARLGRHGDVVNGGPLLVRNGRQYVDAYAEGFVQPDRPDFFYGFGVRRNPRTMAGVTAARHLLLVAVEGRRPDYSVGLSFSEESAVMAALGAKDALNLDGGGSTTAVGPGATVLGRPSDTTGERPVGDAVLLYARDRRPGADGR